MKPETVKDVLNELLKLNVISTRESLRIWRDYGIERRKE